MDLVTVFETQKPTEAELIKSLLAAAEILSFIADENTVLAPLGIRVQVSKSDEKAARDIIASVDSSSE